MRRRTAPSRALPRALAPALICAALAACEPAPDAAEWEQMAARDEAESIEETLARNTGTLDLEPLLDQYRIQTQSIALLGGPDDPAGIHQAARVATDSAAQRFYVWTPTLDGQILVYARNGTLTGTLGQPGQGPGELGGELILRVGAGDSLHVVQSRPARYTVWSPQGALVRSVNLDRRFLDFAVLPSGDVVLNAPEPSPRGEIFRLVQLSPTGEAVRVFDPAPADAPATHARRIGVAGDWLWAMGVARYEVDAWDEDGNHLLDREADPDWEYPEGMMPGLRPDPAARIPGQATGVGGTSDTRAYLYTALPPEGATFQDVQGMPYTRTLVQIVNLYMNQVFVAGELDGIVQPLRRNLAYRVVERANGETRVEVLELSYRR